MRIHFSGFDPGQMARRETLFHAANGYVGMRASFEEGLPPSIRSVRGTYINGFFDSAPIHYEEKLFGFAQTQQSIINVIDTQGIAIKLGGEDFSCLEGRLDSFEQTLDMEKGVYTREIVWTSAKGRRTQLVFQRLASFVMEQLILLRAEATPLNWSGEILFASTQRGDVSQDFDVRDPRKASVGKKMLKIAASSQEVGGLLMKAETLHSGLAMASAVGHEAQGAFSERVSISDEVNQAEYVFQAREGQALSLTKYCVFADSRRFADPAAKALEILGKATERSFSQWAESQQAFLQEFWEQAGAAVYGDEALNASLAFSMYSLLASAGKDGIGNIASKGLSGEGYEGHYFWDTEIYMFPFFLLTNPTLAKKLLDSRAAMLGEAFAHAREMGHQKGALYAWRTITGSECSAYFPSGSAQYHINGAVAQAFLGYWQASGDLAFMAQTGARVLIETARLWTDAGHYAKGNFRIDSVTGPDEYSCVVNNNYYTNRSAQSHLRGVHALCETLEKAGLMDAVREQTGISGKELAAFREAADSMLLPHDEKLGISAQDDAFLNKKRLDLKAIPRDQFPLLMHRHPLFLYRHQVCKQADTVLAHFLYEEGVQEEVIKRSYDYYEELTTHDSSLSECMFSMMAARTGQTEKAYQYYRDSAELDLKDTHGNTADGIHAANMGGCWMGIVYGFGGLRLHRDGLVFRPCLPQRLKGYAFHLCYQGSQIGVEVKREGVSIRKISGPEIDITVYGDKHHLRDELNLPLKDI